ncbi:MAG: hypothetical protein ABI791_13700 [Acidobacteriota bacterium]
MLRKTLSVIIGLVIAVVTFSIFEWIGQLVYPAPQGFNKDDLDALREFILQLPAGAFLMIAAGWAVGSFLAGFAEKTISRSAGIVPPIIIGVVLTIGAVANFVMLPHPVWFVILGLLIFVPVTLLGHKAVPSR